MFIGEGPGYHKPSKGKPFVGRRAVLDELLACAGLKRAEVFITTWSSAARQQPRPETRGVESLRPVLERPD
jgi:uracil-DNA glycosylase family 4